MAPIDYCVALAEGRIAPPANLDIATVQEQELAMTFRFHVAQYLRAGPPTGRSAASPRRLIDFAALNARSKFWGDDGRAAFKNWEEVADPRNPLGGRQGVDERIMLRELLRRVDMMVMFENRLDALVRLHTPLPPAKIGGADEPGVRQNLRPNPFYGPNAGLTEVLIPAGYVTTVYDPVFSPEPRPHPLRLGRLRHADQDAGAPGLPFSLVFRAEPGGRSRSKIASAYEAASKRRIPPPAFGPLPHRNRRAFEERMHWCRGEDRDRCVAVELLPNGSVPGYILTHGDAEWHHPARPNVPGRGNAAHLRLKLSSDLASVLSAFRSAAGKRVVAHSNLGPGPAAVWYMSGLDTGDRARRRHRRRSEGAARHDQEGVAALKKREQKLHEEFLRLDQKSRVLDEQLSKLRAAGPSAPAATARRGQWAGAAGSAAKGNGPDDGPGCRAARRKRRPGQPGAPGGR